MKRILLVLITISLCGFLAAQEKNWKVYLRGQAVKSIDFENNYIWATTDSFLIQLNRLDNSTTYFSYPYKHVNRSSFILKIDKKGVKWIALSEYFGGESIYTSYSSSVYSFDGSQWKTIRYWDYGQISSLAIDKSNNKWIAKAGENGLYKIEQDNYVQYTPENSGLVYNYVSQVASDKDGNIWVLNLAYGPMLSADIALIKNDGVNWITYYSGEGHSIDFITIDSQGNPWLSLQKLDTISNSLSYSFYTDTLPPSLRVGSLPIIEGEDKLWYNIRKKISVWEYLANGIASLQDSDWNFYTTANSELPSDTVYQIAIDADGTKWIGTVNGLAAFNENGLTTSTDIHPKKIKEIELFPNPANDYIILKIPSGLMNSRIDILNLQGKTIKSFSLNQHQKRLGVSHFPTGVYIVRIHSGENQIIKKFVKR